MNEQPIEDRIAQRVVARILPYLNGNGAKPTLKRLLSVREAAIYLGRYKENRAGVKEASESSIYHLVSRGELPCIRHGRTVRFDVRDLDRWIEGDKS